MIFYSGQVTSEWRYVWAYVENNNLQLTSISNQTEFTRTICCTVDDSADSSELTTGEANEYLYHHVTLAADQTWISAKIWEMFSSEKRASLMKFSIGVFVYKKENVQQIEINITFYDLKHFNPIICCLPFASFGSGSTWEEASFLRPTKKYRRGNKF